MGIVNWTLLCPLFHLCGATIMPKKKEEKKTQVSNEDVVLLIEELTASLQYTLEEQAVCMQVIAKSIKNIGRRLEMLEDHVYNNDGLDDELLN